MDGCHMMIRYRTAVWCGYLAFALKNSAVQVFFSSLEIWWWHGRIDGIYRYWYCWCMYTRTLKVLVQDTVESALMIL